MAMIARQFGDGYFMFANGTVIQEWIADKTHPFPYLITIA